MKKITDFIIDKRNIVLIAFIIFSIISIFLSAKVNINYDIAKYLPSDSETRIGMDLMETKLKELKSSSFNLMFKDLDNNEKENVFEELSNIKGIDSINYDKTDNYNKDNYTLYIINVADASDSELAKNVFNKVLEKYEDYEIYTSGDIASSNEDVLPTWIVILAVTCALVILIVMCSSYIEPFLFLTVILIAVLLNNGTNIIFNNVSNITSSISAILQMALSMDYSIMLMNRYSQEKMEEKDKTKAMKKALNKSFSSISSSSVTTIVGLLALVFMSFTIGRDLGFVLAKGVLLSLISIFTCLPALILIFDKLIIKTKKKSPNIRLDKLGMFSYKIRKISIFLFIGAFIFSFLTKGNLKILYTENEGNKIKDIFKTNNQMAIVYKNKDEEKLARYCRELEKKEGIDKTLCYSNTINEKLQYNELNKKLTDLGSTIEVDDYLLRILFYNYYNKEEKNKMTFQEFIEFIQNEVTKNEEMNSKIDDKMKQNIDKLESFANIEDINRKRTSAEIANILEINTDNVDDILIYYGSKNITNKMSLVQFSNFMNNYVLKSEKYSKSIDSSIRDNLNILTSFTNINTITNKIDSQTIAKLFGIDLNVSKDLYLYYLTQNEIEETMTIDKFINFVINNVLSSDEYKDKFDFNTIQNLNTLKRFSDKTLIMKEMNSKELSIMFNMDETIIKQLLYLQYKNVDNNTKIDFKTFITTVDYLKNSTNYLKDVDVSSIISLINYPQFMNDPNVYTASEVATILNIDSGLIYNLYALIDLINNNTNTWTMTPNNFATLILTNKDNISIDDITIKKLTLLSTIMSSSINNTVYKYQELANLTDLDSTIVKSIYSLYLSTTNSLKLTPIEFVDFILNHKEDELLSKNISNETISSLILLSNIMDSTVNNTYYNVNDLSKLLNINTSSLSLIYSLYNYQNNNSTISLKEIVDFLLTDVITNEEYKDNFDSEKINKLKIINGIMNSSIKNVKYTKNEMFGILSKLTNEIDKKMIDLLYIYYGSEKEYNNKWTLTVEEFVNYLNNTILNDERFNDFIEKDIRKNIKVAKKDIRKAKELLVGNGYSRIVLNTNLDLESNKTFDFIKDIKDDFKKRNLSNAYIIGNSPMAYEMSQTFNNELDFITILTMIAIFVVVAFTFKSIIIPIILVLLIQCAVYMTMGILSFTGGTVYFIALLIVQSILMGATIDYAILYTSYYLEHRRTMNIKKSIINSYNKSIHTILTSSSILIIVTLIVGCFASAIAAKICKTLSEGTLCSSLLILILLPAVLAMCDRLIIKKKD